MPKYNPSVIEPKWQKWWAEQKTFRSPRLPSGKKAYILDMFPYPSGDGLHVGHPEGYTATDIVSRFERMRGTSVVHPMGFDAFGLPAEEHAIRTGTPPRASTERNIATFKRQLQMLGFSYDWERETSTTDPEFVRWTQWIFLLLYDTWFDAGRQQGRPISELPIPEDVQESGDKAVNAYRDDHRLAYSRSTVNWCGTWNVLANEEVVGGLSERGGHPVVRLPLRQWMLRITAYADRLGAELDGLDWPESIKKLQRDWIGRSTGAEVDFFLPPQGLSGKDSKDAFRIWKSSRERNEYPVKAPSDCLRIYTTRPDTLFGVSCMVIAPEHPLRTQLTMPAEAEVVNAYCEAACHKSDLDRTDLAQEKTGVFTGSYCIHPLTGESVPIWVADYVLASYGTGAIMSVPAHDSRDFEFAQIFKLKIISVVEPIDDTTEGTEIFTGYGRASILGNIQVCAVKPLLKKWLQIYSIKVLGGRQQTINCVIGSLVVSGFGASHFPSCTRLMSQVSQQVLFGHLSHTSCRCRFLSLMTFGRTRHLIRHSLEPMMLGCTLNETVKNTVERRIQCLNGLARAGII